MKKIAIDISQIIYGTGVSNLTSELVSATLNLDKNNQYILFGSSLRGYFKLKKFAANFPNVSKRIFPFPIFIFEVLFHRLNLPIELFCGKINVFHCSDWLTPRSFTAKIILPVYDLTTKISPEDHQSKVVSIHETRIQRGVKYASFITFLSKSTRNDFNKFYKFDEANTEIIYPSTFITQIKPKPFRLLQKKFQISKPYLLSVSTLQPRKNLQTLVNAFENIHNRKNYQLIIVGPKGWGNINLISNEDIIQTGFIEKSELACLYKNAKVFIYPSYYEGFGLPIIEAMSFGVPTIVSNSSSMPEAGGKAAIYFNPADSKELSSKLNAIISFNSQKLKRISSESRRQSARFSWILSAKKIISIYEKL